MSPQHSQEIIDDGSESDFDPLNPDIQEDEGWEDAEPDEEENFNFVSLFDDYTMPSLREMIEHDKRMHGFDLVAVKTQLKLDFVGTIKLVNYIRTETKAGNDKPDVSSTDRFFDDKYLLPVLQDDPVLFSLGDLEQEGDGQGATSANETELTTDARVERLEAELNQAREMIAELRLISQRNLEDADEPVASKTTEANRKEKAVLENDKSYFKSYAYNDIHETMLKDTIRTDAYRDFIYDNKDVFAGKIVLDVGCGTGILSMMCAKAGAKQVFAVDNSDIINKARANVFENGLEKIVTCLHGKIEDVVLPVDKVDIIVSEWMGYALLYESMLDSVISARDRYLAPDGLMVPSHSSLFVAPISVPDIVTERIGFWQDVYGFRMPAMLEGIYDEIMLRNLGEADVVGTPSEFLQLSLHTTKVEDTTFTEKRFSSRITKDSEQIDGFAIWFDMFFARSRDVEVPTNMQASDWKKGVAFTTGPGKSTTHWQQVVLLVNNTKDKAARFSLQTGGTIEGLVGYERRQENDRELDISLKWRCNEQDITRSQKWELT